LLVVVNAAGESGAAKGTNHGGILARRDPSLEAWTATEHRDRVEDVAGDEVSVVRRQTIGAGGMEYSHRDRWYLRRSTPDLAETRQPPLTRLRARGPNTSKISAMMQFSGCTPVRLSEHHIFLKRARRAAGNGARGSRAWGLSSGDGEDVLGEDA
jgi:hypothetical protein